MLRRSLVLLSLAAIGARAQAPPPLAGRNFVSIVPVELFYKTQLGYERQTGERSSLGAIGTARYGLGGRYSGWQATGYYRRFLTGSFPTGLYAQAEASVFNFQQEAHLYNPQTREYFLLEYRGVSGGGGIGLGYRNYFLRQATHGHLLWNAMLGGRVQARPEPTYDTAIYRPESTFVGNGDDFNWHMGFSPGSIMHGTFTLDYRF